MSNEKGVVWVTPVISPQILWPFSGTTFTGGSSPPTGSGLAGNGGGGSTYTRENPSPSSSGQRPQSSKLACFQSKSAPFPSLPWRCSSIWTAIMARSDRRRSSRGRFSWGKVGMLVVVVQGKWVKMTLSTSQVIYIFAAEDGKGCYSVSESYSTSLHNFTRDLIYQHISNVSDV